MVLVQYDEFNDFTKEVKKLGVSNKLDKLKTTHSFTEINDKYMTTSFKSFKLKKTVVIVVTKNKTVTYPKFKLKQPKLNPKFKTPYWNSTITYYSVLRMLMDEYADYFDNINNKVHILSERVNIEPAETMEAIEHITLDLRKFIDALEDLLKIIIKVEEKAIRFVDVKAIGYEYKVLITESRLLWDRARNSRKELNILLHKCNTLEAHELNDNFVKLTKIAAILAIIAVIISVPNTVATIFGVPTLAALVTPLDVVFLMIITTIIAIIISWWYLRKYL